ncbi:MAG TPA: PHP domain-containing protein, partial [bacterium]|nr:PHP domain-containing protein [bacterium]
MFFFHLHNHFFGSFSDSILEFDEAINSALSNGHKALAITDHGTLSAIYPFYFKCKEKNIIPILGCEIYFSLAEPIKDNLSHLSVIAKNIEGLKNLVQLTSEAWTNYFLPPKYAVINWENLIRHKNGLIILSACVGGPIGKNLKNGNPAEAEKWFKLLKSEFGSDFYPEVSGHKIAYQSENNEFIKRMSEKYNCSPVATNDCHYSDYKSSHIHDILIKTSEKYVSNFSYGAKCFYFKSNEEMFAMNFPQKNYDVCSEILGKITLHNELESSIFNIVSNRKKTSLLKLPVAEPFKFNSIMAFETVSRAYKVSEPKISKLNAILKQYDGIEAAYEQNKTFRDYCSYYSININTMVKLNRIIKSYFPDYGKFVELDEDLRKIIPLRRIYGELFADITLETLKKFEIPILNETRQDEIKTDFFSAVKLWFNGEYERALQLFLRTKDLKRDALFFAGDCFYKTGNYEEAIDYFKKYENSSLPSYHTAFFARTKKITAVQKKFTNPKATLTV